MQQPWLCLYHFVLCSHQSLPVLESSYPNGLKQIYWPSGFGEFLTRVSVLHRSLASLRFLHVEWCRWRPFLWCPYFFLKTKTTLRCIAPVSAFPVLKLSLMLLSALIGLPGLWWLLIPKMFWPGLCVGMVVWGCSWASQEFSFCLCRRLPCGHRFCARTLCCSLLGSCRLCSWLHPLWLLIVSSRHLLVIASAQ